jgi:hypothetical protein
MIGACALPVNECFTALSRAVKDDPPYHATVMMNSYGVSVDTSQGRFIRPLFILPLKPYDATMTLDDLIQNDVIEMIDPARQSTIVIAVDAQHITPQTTHMELHPSFIFGLSTGFIPFASHNPAPRATFQTSMSNATIGVASFANRWESTKYVLEYPQHPLVETQVQKTIKTLPALTNCVIMLDANPFGQVLPPYPVYHSLTLTQEDSIIINRSSIEFGLMRSSVYTSYHDTVSAPSVFARSGAPRVALRTDVLRNRSPRET